MKLYNAKTSSLKVLFIMVLVAGVAASFTTCKTLTSFYCFFILISYMVEPIPAEFVSKKV